MAEEWVIQRFIIKRNEGGNSQKVRGDSSAAFASSHFAVSCNSFCTVTC